MRGSHLLDINDESEYNFIVKFVKDQKLSDVFWIGLNDLVTEGDFRWSDGTKPTFAAWRSGEPNDFQMGEDCVRMRGGWEEKWNDLDCTIYNLGFVCEINNGELRLIRNI